MTRTKRLAAAAAAIAAAALVPLTAVPADAATGPATHYGMTWGGRRLRAGGQRPGRRTGRQPERRLPRRHRAVGLTSRTLPQR